MSGWGIEDDPQGPGWDDHREDHVATMSEAVDEWARNAGHLWPDRCWLLHDYDVWVRNPHYVGPPVPHPEDYE